jgi:hypothetical protein
MMAFSRTDAFSRRISTQIKWCSRATGSVRPLISLKFRGASVVWRRLGDNNSITATDASEAEPRQPALSAASFENLVQHWARARLNSPLEAIRRFDEAAKQLITLVGVLQALFFAVLALGDIRTHLPRWAAPTILTPLLILVFGAARVICTVPLKTEAIDTYLLLKRIISPDRCAAFPADRAGDCGDAGA